LIYTDELIKDVLLGGLYTIIGIPVYQLCGTSANIDISIEVFTLTLSKEIYILKHMYKFSRDVNFANPIFKFYVILF